MDNLRDQLLQQDGLDADGVTEQELHQFRALLAQEQRRARRLGWLMQIPILVWLAILIGLIVSESLLETLNIPFVTAFNLVLIGMCIVLVPWARRLGARLKQSQNRILIFKHKLPEHADKRARGIPLVARYEETKFVFWPGVLLVTLLACIVSVIVGNAAWWFSTGSFLRFPMIWWIVWVVLIVVLVIRFVLIRPISILKELESPDSRLWIAAPRIICVPILRVFWKTCIVCVVGMLGFIGVLSVYLFFQGNDVYARAMNAFERAQSIHAIGYGFTKPGKHTRGQRIKQSEIRYQAGRGTHIQWLRDKQVIDMYDDGQYRYDYVQGNDYAVKKKSQKPLLPRELTELARYLKWSRRYASRDRQVRGVMYRCYRREDSNTRSLMWIDWISGTPRFRVYEKYRRVNGQWQQEELIEVDYDPPMDLVMPPDVFEQQNIRIVEPEKAT